MLPHQQPDIAAFFTGKSEYTIMLFNYFIAKFEDIGSVGVEATKTMVGVSNTHKRIAWVTQLGKNFIHVVFPFKKEYPDNLCFQKVGQVPGQQQFNHHFRMLQMDDLNDEVLAFMRLAYIEEQDA